MPFYEKIHEQNKLLLNKPANNNRVYYSELREWHSNNAFRSFSVKYVLSEKIYYRNENKEFCVQAGQYLLACHCSNVKAYFESKAATRSICIDICAKTIAEVFTVLTSRRPDLDNDLAGYFSTPSFYEHLLPVAGNRPGMQLQKLQKQIELGREPLLSKSWFMQLAEQIIYQEYGNYRYLNQINSVKPTTRKELLHRLQQARSYMDQHFLDITGIKEIAAYCAMSEYHFYRRFKEVYRQTPNQYITEKKLLLAKELLLQKKHSVTEIAGLCSYPDIFTFSKAFKKFFGVPPSTLR